MSLNFSRLLTLNKISVNAHLVAFAAITLVLTACGGPVRVSVRAMAPVNVNADGESTPVKVRFYPLRDDTRFLAVPFNDVWLKDAETLGDDRLGDAKVVIVPPSWWDDTPLDVELTDFSSKTRFIGVMALIQDADVLDRRRAVVPVSDADGVIIDIIDSTIVVHEDRKVVPQHIRPAVVKEAPPVPLKPAPVEPVKPAPAANAPVEQVVILPVPPKPPEVNAPTPASSKGRK